jgi:hypothetical protein
MFGFEFFDDSDYYYGLLWVSAMFLLELLLEPEDGRDMVLQNFEISPNCTELQPEDGAFKIWVKLENQKPSFVNDWKCST